MGDNWINVSIYDENLNRYICKIIDKNGNEKFHSEEYSSIWTCPTRRNKGTLNVTIKDKNEIKRGLIDENGNKIYPCESNIVWNGFYYKEKLVKYTENKKIGLKNFNGEIVIQAIYSDVIPLNENFFNVHIDNNDKILIGLINSKGKTIVPIEFESINMLRDNKHIACCKKGFCQMLEIIEK